MSIRSSGNASHIYDTQRRPAAAGIGLRSFSTRSASASSSSLQTNVNILTSTASRPNRP
jgi:hypothetical protein